MIFFKHRNSKSEENYQWLEKKRITAYVKYNQFDRMQNETIRNKNPITVDKLFYDERNNQFIFPIGEPMEHIGWWTIEETKAGYPRVIDKYKASNYRGCFVNNGEPWSGVYRLFFIWNLSSAKR